jgi:hypothetical protein
VYQEVKFQASNSIVSGVPSVPAFIKQAAIDITALSLWIPGKLCVMENSGVCKTMNGVYHVSGYGHLMASESVWCVVVLVLWLSGRTVWGVELMLFGFWFVRFGLVLVVYSHRFWFFAARENTGTKLLVLWFNGGYVRHE